MLKSAKTLLAHEKFSQGLIVKNEEFWVRHAIFRVQEEMSTEKDLLLANFIDEIRSFLILGAIRDKKLEDFIILSSNLPQCGWLSLGHLALVIIDFNFYWCLLDLPISFKAHTELFGDLVEVIVAGHIATSSLREADRSLWLLLLVLIRRVQLALLDKILQIVAID